jgi:tetratricopeptide (TPR) repeat protein
MRRRILCVMIVGLLGSRTAAAQTAPASAAFGECRVLYTLGAFDQAIARCDEAIRLEPKWPNPYFMLASAHDSLSWKEAYTSPGADASRIPEHRRQASETYKKFLALTQDDTAQRRPRTVALSKLLWLYLGGEPKADPALEYAEELARQPSLTKLDLFALAGVYIRHERPELSEQFLKRVLQADASDARACQALAALYLEMPGWTDGPRFDDRIATLESCAVVRVGDATAHFALTQFFWDKASRDTSLTAKQKMEFVERALGHVDRALSLKQDFVKAQTLKGELLRMKAAGGGTDAV